ncbi:hypothetical protein DRP53_02000 [candidate division WOR-3 bacterium]|uniref:Putative zinc-finger domain-containing protein n=1 Tax=candidate division WOR-3 bacterium TaxID=2052148 RepID=A0A660SME7_UNCW3|nr:MAG: hypothetical protein DRP53_02000 [candidate division WOR-3 bacterium]
MNCEEIREVLIDYLNNDLDPEEMALVQSHLQSCPGCAREFQILKEMIVCCQEPIEYRECYIEEFVYEVRTRIARQKRMRTVFRYLPIALVPIGLGLFLFFHRPKPSPVPVYLDSETRVMIDSLSDQEFNTLLDRIRQVSLSEE